MEAIISLLKTSEHILVTSHVNPDGDAIGSLLAVGAALASRIRKDKSVSVSFFGDGATGEGVLYEALNFAALKDLPILFVCENNFYSTHMPIRECRINDMLYEIGKPCNIYTKQVDGNNVLEVYEAASRAVELCRRNEGPAFIECLTYRLRGHVGPDDHIQGSHMDIRPHEEVEAWIQKDPINAFQNHLLTSGLITPSQIEQIILAIDAEIQEAYRFTHNSPLPQPDELLNHVYR